VKLAVSNIAWEPSQDDAVAELLHREGVRGVEIAPTKWRDRPLEVSSADIAAYRRRWEDRGLPIVSLQALLFGRPDLQLFGEARRRAEMLAYLRGIMRLAAGLGAHALVFGSPKNRLRGSMPLPTALDIATKFFRAAGEHAREQGVALCIEANPPAYGCDFITTTAEAVELCRLINHPAIRVNADLGGMTMTNEDVGASLDAAKSFIGHFHASEPNLVTLGETADHEAAGATLAEMHYTGWVSIEMRTSIQAHSGENLPTIENAVRLAAGAYGRVV
jgi:D-psicose/D-tagatose/L-ribulose 3-epimerase